MSKALQFIKNYENIIVWLTRGLLLVLMGSLAYGRLWIAHNYPTKADVVEIVQDETELLRFQLQQFITVKTNQPNLRDDINFFVPRTEFSTYTNSTNRRLDQIDTKVDKIYDLLYQMNQSNGRTRP